MKVLFVISFVMSVSAFAQIELDGKSTKRCLQRIERSCKISIWGETAARQNVQMCRQVAQGMEAVLLKSGKVSVVDTSQCVGHQYEVGDSQINDFRIVNQRVYMLSNEGRVYFMDDGKDFYEILNPRGKSYFSVVDVQGAVGSAEVELILEEGKTIKLSQAALLKKAQKGQLRKLHKYEYKGLARLFLE